ncbi:YbaN family protein [Altericroceibacterium indicum]|nr:YbaN family protein [Altericroceibacterium indicum]
MRRSLYMAAGLVCVGLGAIGAALPIMPTVPFLLLAAFCFARGNPEWERRLLHHPRWGPSLRHWRDHRAIGRKAKVSAILAMGAGVLFTGFTLGFPWVLISIAVLAICGSWIWTRPE